MLAKVAGEGTDLHRKHRVHVQMSAVATVPENYEGRLIEVFAGEFDNLRIFILDPYDTRAEQAGTVRRGRS